MLLAGATGWVLGVWLGLAREAGPVPLVVAGLAAAISLFIARSGPESFAAAAFLSLLVLGVLRGSAATAGEFRPPPGRPVAVEGYVEDVVHAGTYVLSVTRPYAGRALLFARPGSNLRYGDEIGITGMPALQPDLAAWQRSTAAASGVDAVFVDPAVEVLGSQGGSAVGRSLWALRRNISRMLERHIPWPYAALGEGLLLGGSTGVDPEIRDDFRSSGLSHLLAASGYNVALVALFVFVIAGPVAGRRRAVPVSLLAVAVYVGLSGLSASVLRAGVMSAVALIGLRAGRQYDGGRSLAAAAVLLTAWQPLTVRDVGAQLSFAATAGLIWIYPVLERAMCGLPGAVTGVIGLTLSCQLVTLPISIYYFSTLSPWTLVSNVAAAPLVPVGMAFSALTLLGGALGYVPGQMIGAVAGQVLAALTGVAQLFADLPGSGIVTGPVSSLVVWGYYAMLLVSVLLFQRRPGRAPAGVQLP